jgi:hypothetical protein
MPTNLPPDYFDVDRRFREAESPAEKVTLLEEMIRIVPKHKGTDHLRADLRRQLSRLREEAHAQKKASSHKSAYQIEREGAGQAVLVGPTNTGKSSLVAALTHAEPEISEAPFTTWAPLPGMMPYEGIQIQLIDTPPMQRGLAEPILFDLVRKTDLILLVADLLADPILQIRETLLLLEEHRILPTGKQSALNDRLTRIPFLVLANKYDNENMDDLFEICCELVDAPWPLIPVSALSRRNFNAFKRIVFEQLQIIRVFAKPPGQEPDLDRPFALKQGATVIDLARKVHRDFYEHLKSARVWGSSAFAGQMVQRDYILHDKDIVELRV